jgi:hypothetical protein
VTVEELTKLFDDAAAQEHLRNLSAPDYKFDVRDMVRAGVTAIVWALRDELSMSKDINSCSACDANYDLFHEILGDAGEKVAGNNEGYSHAEPSPATDPVLYSPALERLVTHADPAPAVCVWTHKESWIGEGVAGEAGCDGARRFRRRKRNCPSCGLPIKFTEAK